MKIISIFILIFCLFAFKESFAQEHVGPLGYNPIVHDANRKDMRPFLRTTAASDTITLPFFDDFSGNGIFPDSRNWVDNAVYINNTMCINPPTRGVATFDMLNGHGLPYDTVDNSAIIYADSLTSRPINISALSPADSVYVSFFYQPGGNGFYPSNTDSLMLFLHKKNNDWVKVWSVFGSPPLPFQQVMIPVADTSYFDSGFQFRFVNKGSFNYSGASWQLDYVRMDKNRNMNDTVINDVSYIGEPGFILNDYTSMPYRQFLANITGERATQHGDTIKNYTNAAPTINYGYTAKEITTGTSLGSSTGSITIPAYSEQAITFPVYTSTISSPGTFNRVVFENKYYLTSPATDTVKQNDTIVRQQVFDNYLAYDDGSAEKSYFLDLFPLLPGYVAVEHHVNQLDSIQGVAIYFARQVPLPTYKSFSIFVYSTLQGINGAIADDTLYWQDISQPGYIDTLNHFWIYKFNKSVMVHPGSPFYVGIFQPAFSGSDSLYFGLDANRIGGNHAYYNVLSVWNSSGVQGAIMIRPLLGLPVKGSGIDEVVNSKADWQIFPNPAKDVLNIDIGANRIVNYEITDLRGSVLMRGKISQTSPVNISKLIPGLYFVKVSADGTVSKPKKFTKE